MQINLSGFSSLLINEQEIESTNLTTLLRNPMYDGVDADFIYKNGGEFNRMLLNLTPLTNKKKYVYVRTKIHYLTPSTLPIKNNQWHCDYAGNLDSDNTLIHLALIGEEDVELSSKTEFLTKDIKLFLDDSVSEMRHPQFRTFLDDFIFKNHLESKSIPQNKMVTFKANHIHRAVFPTKSEFRLIWRVVETDNLPPATNSNDRLYTSNVTYYEDNVAIKEIPSIEQHDNYVIVRDRIKQYI